MKKNHPPGVSTSEYQLTRLSIIANLIICLGLMGLVALGRMPVEALLLLLAPVLASGQAVSTYTAKRGELKRTEAQQHVEFGRPRLDPEELQRALAQLQRRTPGGL